jgi:hypothetical protein
MATLSPSPERDAAVATLVSAQAQSDPATAFQWASTIGNDESRNEQLLSVVVQWTKSNPDAASAAVQNSSLPADQRATLIQAIQSSIPPAKRNPSPIKAEILLNNAVTP